MELEDLDARSYGVAEKIDEWEKRSRIGGPAQYKSDPIEDQKREHLENLRQEYVREYGEEYGTKLAQQQADAMGIPLKGTYTQPYLEKAKKRIPAIEKESEAIIGGLQESLGKEWTDPFFQLATLKEKAAYDRAKRKWEQEAVPSKFFGKGVFPGGEFVPPKFGEYGFEYKHHEPNRYGQAGGGLANLTRPVAPDSGPVSRGVRSLYIDDMD